MKPSSFNYDLYLAKWEDIDRQAPLFATGDMLPVMQWNLGEGAFSFNSQDKTRMLEAQLDGITCTLEAHNDQPPHLEPWHGVGVFAQAFGSPYIWIEDDAPWTRPIVNDLDGLQKLQKPVLDRCNLLQQVLETTEYFNTQTRGQVAIAATDTQSALSTLSLICDTTWMLTEAWTYPEDFHRVLNDITDTIIDFTRLQRALCSKPVQPGHTMWSPTIGQGISVSDDLLALVGSSFYREFGLPYDEKLGQALGGIGVHSCGCWNHNFDAVKTLKSIRMVDLAVSYDFDPSPLDPNKVVQGFAGANIAVQARCNPEDREIVDTLLRADLKLILSLWWNDDPLVRNRYYDDIKARWERYRFEKDSIDK
jgi:hypothetical protein